MKKLAIILISVTVISLVIVNLLKKDMWDVNADLLKEEVLSIEPSKKEIRLAEVTPFDWEVVHFFTPYTPKEDIYEEVGYKWDYISETVNEGMNQIVFMKDEQVVCYLYGYPENNGFGISLVDAYSTSVLRKEDRTPFQVTTDDGVIYLQGA